jgi:nitrogen fixation protein NifX
MKVAFATIGGIDVDEHFGRASQFAIWDVSPGDSRFVEIRRMAEGEVDDAVVSTRGSGAEHDEAVRSKVDRLDDCKIVYFNEIGGPSAAKLVQRGIMPLKVAESTPIEPTAQALAERLADNPAPWMRKALADEVCAGPASLDDVDSCSCQAHGKGTC